MNPAVFEALSQSHMVRDYADSFHQATGLTLRLASADLTGQRCSCGRHGNPFCEMIHKTVGGCRACAQIQKELQRRLTKKLAPQQMRCPAGLTDVAVPVLIAGEHVATLFGGQVFRQPPRRADFERMVRTLRGWGHEHDWAQLERAYFGTPVISRDRFRAMVRLLTIFAQQLGDSAHRWMLAKRNGEPKHVANAKDYVHAHFHERLTMHETARQVGISPFYFCRMFRKVTGLTFTEYVSRVRVEKAKERLGDRSVRIGEVAYAVGFQSIPHFDRMFKRYAGSTPHDFRSERQRDG